MCEEWEGGLEKQVRVRVRVIGYRHGHEHGHEPRATGTGTSVPVTPVTYVGTDEVSPILGVAGCALVSTL